MRTDMLLLILGMAAVTYIPRALPGLLIQRFRFSPRMEQFFRLLPYTAMAALICPGIFAVDAARPEIGIVGGLVAAALAWKKQPVMTCVVAAIFVDLLLYLAL